MLETTKLLVTNALFLLLLAQKGQAWFSCDEVDYCARLRYKEPSNVFSLENLEQAGDKTVGTLVNSETGKKLDFALSLLSSKDTLRITIDDPENPRHRVTDSLDGEPQYDRITIEAVTGGYKIKSEEVVLVSIETRPFSLTVAIDDGPVLAKINSRGRLVFEEQEPEVAVAVDVTFPGTQRAYGLPSHADRLPLGNTRSAGRDPYRFYNIDHAGYPVNSTQALYGTIPVLYAFSKERSAGVFWQNSAQTFVDIENEEDGVSTYFFSESGVIDLFVFVGPRFRDVVKQYASLTGVAPVPPYFSLGYHQSRYNYFSTEDLETVVKEFDNHNLPLDVVWLDIEYTDSIKYFTWNPENFSDPIAMQEFLRSTGRKLVVIIDPHIFVEEGYFFYDETKAKDYFVKDAEGNIYEGKCWPGISSWIDFFDPEARDYWSTWFAFDKFEGTTDIVHIWNDMNEPAVFEGYEGSMPKDNVHYGGWLHRDVHNQYGFYMTMATYKGLVDRGNGEQRPFVLTRSHFPGSQRYTAMWTGDNVAEFAHLYTNIPMCLSSALGGLSFCGADIGGFLQDPTEELLTRWYQVGIWLPFFRQHSSIETQRREPYLYNKDALDRFRYAIELRYKHLPYWYTLFYEHYRTGEPVIKPLLFNYEDDVNDNLLDNDRQWLVGDNIIASPILEEGAEGITFYLPGGQNQLWYDVENTLLYRGIGYYTREADISSNNYFYRGGSIIPRRDTIRSSSEYTHDDPITLYVFLDGNSEAEGTLYVDDATSFKYQQKEYLYVRYSFADNAISSSKIDEDANYEGTVTIGSVVIYRPPSGIKAAKIRGDARDVKEVGVTYEEEGKILKVEDLNLDARKPFVVQLV